MRFPFLHELNRTGFEGFGQFVFSMLAVRLHVLRSVLYFPIPVDLVYFVLRFHDLIAISNHVILFCICVCAFGCHSRFHFVPCLNSVQTISIFQNVG